MFVKFVRASLIAAAVCVFPVFASDQSSALTDFTKRLESLNAMETQFQQVTMDQSGEILQSLSGTLAVMRPGKMRWQTRPPYEQLVVSDGKVVWVYDMDLEQVTVRDLEMRLQETPALLLSGDVSGIADSYTVSRELVGEVVRFRLKPLDASQLFDSLEFDYVGEQVAYMRIYDAAGQSTEIQFTGQQVNPMLDEVVFTFVIPDDVDVIDGRHGG